MRALAFPGEDPATLKGPEVVAQAVLERLLSDVPSGERVRIEGR